MFCDNCRWIGVIHDDKFDIDSDGCIFPNGALNGISTRHGWYSPTTEQFSAINPVGQMQPHSSRAEKERYLASLKLWDEVFLRSAGCIRRGVKQPNEG